MGGYGDVQMIDDKDYAWTAESHLSADQLRLKRRRSVADGSARVRWGLNDVIAAVYGPAEAHPRKIQRQDRAVLDVRYNMAPFSTTDESGQDSTEEVGYIR